MTLRLYVLLLASVTPTLRVVQAEEISFAHQIRPLLASFCFDCHGRDDARREAGMRLDLESAWRTPLKSGKTLLVPGKRGDSELWRRVTTSDTATHMPPPTTKKSLSPEQIELVGRWIDEGAKWSPHWSYVAPVRPTVPRLGQNSALSCNAIDRFVHSRLERESLAPSPLATRQEQLRRVTLDLTGLPPTLAEIDAFLADESPDAYERVVDRLLASPRFGERLAQDWLDLARYADTHGYHADSHRDMWRWRDWVIDAVNRNQPFDQFTIEQLAGDLLPGATLSQKIATGFHRNTMINHENGALAQEYRTEYVMDRVATTGTVWLGQTWLCARCHDHKYDPISQQDFYRLFAYFNNVAENGIDGRSGNAEPLLAAPTEDQQRQLEALAASLKQLDGALRDRAKNCDADFAAWLRKASFSETAALPPDDMAAQFALDDAEEGRTANRILPRQPASIHGNASFVPGKLGQSLLFDGETYVELRELFEIDRDRPFSASLWMYPTSEENGTLLARVDDAFTSRGFTLAWEDRRLIARMRNEAVSDELVVATADQWPLRKWQHIVMVYDGSSRATGVKLYRNGELAAIKANVDTLSGSVATRRPWFLGRRDKEDPWRGMLDEVRLYARSLTQAEVALLAGDDPIRKLLAKPATKRSAEESAVLRRYYLEQHDEVYRRTRVERMSVERQHRQLLQLVPTTMVMRELDPPRETYVLKRGQYDRPGERVEPGVPNQFLKPPADAPANRLGLAKWLIDRRHPLTSRVAVNRYWSHFFGRGLVATPEDFGVRGSPPSHPELLDFLAVEFVERGWDVKHLVRLIVTSRTYRQSSRDSKTDRDPENVLLARGPAVRLTAETIRDRALAAAGLLVERIGGPSVHPYQPTDLWKDLAYDVTSYSAQSFKAGHSGDLYRRSLYTFWKRTSPHPLLTLFDAPNRETCTVLRPTTSSPLQALAMLNDRTIVDASRALATEAIRQRETPSERVQFVFRSALSRSLSDKEQARLLRLHADQLAAFRAEPKSARELTGMDDHMEELAAWMIVAQTLFNTEEFVTK